jgi:hypothetical protein
MAVVQAQYLMLLCSFREQLQQHVRVHAVEAVMACREIEQSLQDLTGKALRPCFMPLIICYFHCGSICASFWVLFFSLQDLPVRSIRRAFSRCSRCGTAPSLFL